MLASISEALARKGLSLENVTTELQHRPRRRSIVRRGSKDNYQYPAAAGGQLEDSDATVDFVVQADCIVTRYLDPNQMQALVDDLSELKQARGKLWLFFRFESPKDGWGGEDS